MTMQNLESGSLEAASSIDLRKDLRHWVILASGCSVLVTLSATKFSIVLTRINLFPWTRLDMWASNDSDLVHLIIL